MAEQLEVVKNQQSHANEKHNSYLSKKYSEFYKLMLQPDGGVHALPEEKPKPVQTSPAAINLKRESQPPSSLNRLHGLLYNPIP